MKLEFFCLRRFAQLHFFRHCACSIKKNCVMCIRSGLDEGVEGSSPLTRAKALLNK
jgi:hypothetical protein